MTKTRLEIHKIGATCLRSADAYLDTAALMAGMYAQYPIVVVVSAMAGVTDRLDQAAAVAGRKDRTKALKWAEELYARHTELLGAVTTHQIESRMVDLGALFSELTDLLQAVALLGQLSLPTRDRILAIGEKLSARLFAWSLEQRQARSRYLDADGFLDTDAKHGQATPLLEVADRTIKGVITPLLGSGEIPVLTGFCGRGPDGATTTLGRGGADLTATFVASALQADAVVLWTDVDGVYSANPKTVPEARPIVHLNYREAAELSYYGAKLLHGRCMIPVSAKRIPVKVKDHQNPEKAGTLIDSGFSPGSHPVKGISAILDQSLVSIEGKGMAGLSGVAEKVFTALARAGISVTMISQSSSEATICLAVPSRQVAGAEIALRRMFREELSAGQVEEIVVRRRVGLLAVVGLGMANTTGVAARVFSPLGKAGINVLAISQGSSELSISLAVDESDVDQAVRIMHTEFGLDRVDTGEDDRRRLDLLFFGFGKIGRELIQLIFDRHAAAFGRLGLSPRVIAVSDRSGYRVEPNGFSRSEMDAMIQAKRDRKGVSSLRGACAKSAVDMLKDALAYRLARPVVVDVTDSDSAVSVYNSAFELGCDVVTANKKPLGGDYDVFEKLRAQIESRARMLKAEATVGAGLPVVDTMEMLLATGDRIRLVEGCFSGTLGFIMSRLEAGEDFSAAVQRAVEAGYTEPDPAADLTGADVARKALILGRLSGLVHADCSLKLEGLVDPSLLGKDPDVLMRELRSCDESMRRRLEAARSQGRVLRYVAKICPESVEVGPMLVAADSGIGNLSGTDNIIVFTTDRYAERPLVITGPGAGVSVTAMGVMSDILRIAAGRR